MTNKRLVGLFLHWIWFGFEVVEEILSLYFVSRVWISCLMNLRVGGVRGATLTLSSTWNLWWRLFLLCCRGSYKHFLPALWGGVNALKHKQTSAVSLKSSFALLSDTLRLPFGGAWRGGAPLLLPVYHCECVLTADCILMANAAVLSTWKIHLLSLQTHHNESESQHLDIMYFPLSWGGNIDFGRMVCGPPGWTSY